MLIIPVPCLIKLTMVASILLFVLRKNELIIYQWCAVYLQPNLSPKFHSYFLLPAKYPHWISNELLKLQMLKTKLLIFPAKFCYSMVFPLPVNDDSILLVVRPQILESSLPAKSLSSLIWVIVQLPNLSLFFFCPGGPTVYSQHIWSHSAKTVNQITSSP